MSSAANTPDATTPLTRGTSDVRLCCALRKMALAETPKALAAIKDATKPRLLPRDLPRLQEAYETRKKYLRGIAPTTDLSTTEGNT